MHLLMSAYTGRGSSNVSNCPSDKLFLYSESIVAKRASSCSRASMNAVNDDLPSIKLLCVYHML